MDGGECGDGVGGDRDGGGDGDGGIEAQRDTSGNDADGKRQCKHSCKQCISALRKINPMKCS